MAFAIALVIHCTFLLVNFPDFKQALVPKKPAHYIVVRKYVPPPPKVEQQRRQTTTELVRRIPVPDTTPDDPEPIVEPVPEILPEPFPDDVEFLIGVPSQPGPTGRSAAAEPLLAGVGGITVPTRIESSYIHPQYPSLAREARLEGRVVLQAVICGDGTVANVTVLTCDQPSLGFEEAAIEAVRLWRYEPALENGRPVDVFFTILVDFELT